MSVLLMTLTIWLINYIFANGLNFDRNYLHNNSIWKLQKRQISYLSKLVKFKLF